MRLPSLNALRAFEAVARHLSLTRAAAIVAKKGLGTDDEARRRMAANGQQMMRDDFDKRRQFDAFLRHFAAISSGELPSR